MIETTGDIWNLDVDWICITTNGMLKKDGTAVMGRGIALDATFKVTNVAKNLAAHLNKYGNIVGEIGTYGDKRIFSFPTKYDWKQDSDIELIRKSAARLRELYEKEFILPKIAIPRPGCGNGNLNWPDVRSVLEPILYSEDFIIVSK